MKEEARERRRELLLRRLFAPGDLFLVLGVLALAVVLFLDPWGRATPGSAAEVVVEVNGREVLRLPLEEEGQYELDGFRGPFLFWVEDGGVRMVDSDCPDKLCVGMGRVSRPGQAVVCLPNRVTLRLEGDGGVDAVQR